MTRLFLSMLVALLGCACGKNEPGTMGGEPGVPTSVATGAPGEAAKNSAASKSENSSIKSEHGSATFDQGETNASGLTRPDASTKAAQP